MPDLRRTALIVGAATGIAGDALFLTVPGAWYALPTPGDVAAGSGGP